MLKSKILTGCLILTSLIGYLEWGKDNRSFLLEAEIEILSKLVADPLSVLHPFVVLPLLGQVLLVFALFQRKRARMLSWTGLVCIGILMVLIFLIGTISLNYRMVASTIPFLLTGIVFIKQRT